MARADLDAGNLLKHPGEHAILGPWLRTIALDVPNGTAYMTDAGMTGDYDSIIGMQKEEPLHRFITGIPSGRFEPAQGTATLSGVAVETDDATGLALKIAPVRVGGRLEPATPGFWTGH